LVIEEKFQEKIDSNSINDFFYMEIGENCIIGKLMKVTIIINNDKKIDEKLQLQIYIFLQSI
jgi:hypothetical protein